MTSNALTGEASHLGFGDGEGERKDLRRRLQGKFRPEFLGRIDEILLFSPLSREACAAIVRQLLRESCERAAEAGVTLTFEEEAIGALVDAGYDRAYGARILRRTVTERVENALSDRLLTGSVRRGDGVHLCVREGALSLEKRPPRGEDL